MQPNVCTDEIKYQLSTFAHVSHLLRNHMRAHCPESVTSRPVGLSSTMCLHMFKHCLEFKRICERSQEVI
jgi:hypothetical protein